MTKRFGIERYLVFFIFILLPFEDSWLQATPLGYAGASLSVVPLLILLVLKTLSGQFSKEFYIFLGYSIIVSLIFTVIYQDLPFDTLIDRGLRVFALYFLYYFTFVYFKESKVDIATPSTLLLIIILTSILIIVFAPEFLNSVSAVHFSETPNFRPRGYSIEASTFGYIAISSILLFCWKKNINIYLGLTASLACTLLISSKGAMMSLLLSAFIYLLLSSKLKLFSKVIGLLLAGFLAIAIAPVIAAVFQADLDEYTSTATRSTMALVSIISVFHSPIGHGFTGYLPYINSNGHYAMDLLSAISPIPLNYSEVANYFVKGAYKSVGAKSFVFDSIIILGLPFIVYFIKIIKLGREKSKISKNPARDILFFYSAISLTFYIPGIGGYISAVIMGACLNGNATKNSK